MLLHAVTTSNLDVIQLVFDHEEKRPVPDRLMSRLYTVGHSEAEKKASAVSVACEMSLNGDLYIMENLINHGVIGNHLLNITLSELQLKGVPLALFHERLSSLSLSSNELTTLPPVIDWKCKNLMFLSLENNKLEALPAGLFSLPKLLTLNAGHNLISHLDSSVWKAPSLKTLHLNKNLLRTLPCPKLPRRNVEEFDSSAIGKQDFTLRSTYQVFGIGHGFINRGAQSPDDRYKSGEGYSLQFLDLSDNKLSVVPDGLPCLAPQLRTLKLSRNRIFDFKSVSDYPAVLKSLELIRNNAEFCIKGVGSSSALTSCCYQSHPGSIINCCHKTHASLLELHHLNVSRNQLTEIFLEDEGSVKSPTHSGPSSSSKLLFPNLKSFSFSYNQLTAVPDGIHKLTGLLNLDISHNERITVIPLKIHLLKDLDGFQYKEVGDPIIHQLDSCKDIGHMRHFLRARQTA